MYLLLFWYISVCLSATIYARVNVSSLGCYKSVFQTLETNNNVTVNEFFKGLSEHLFPHGTSANDAKFDSRYSINDTLLIGYTDLWHIKSININGLMLPLSPYLGENVDIYILDGFIDSKHPEFERVENIFSIHENCDEYDYIHGTIVASMAAGLICGLAKSSTIYSVCLYDCDEMRMVSEKEGIREIEVMHILRGIAAVVHHREKLYKQQPNIPRKCIVNMSFGLALDPKAMSIISESFDILDNDPNVLLLAAAGNHGNNVSEIWPAADPRVISVGAYNSKLELSTFTNLGANVNGPGEEVLVADTKALLGYSKKSGTSLACPFISGLAASIWSVFTDWKSSQVKEFVVNYMKSIKDI